MALRFYWWTGNEQRYLKNHVTLELICWDLAMNKSKDQITYTLSGKKKKKGLQNEVCHGSLDSCVALH